MGFIKTNERCFQKNRYFSNPKEIKLTYGDSGLVTSREGFIELIHLSLFKKYLKNFIKKKKSHLLFIREKIWYFGRINYALQKKSKNSRMGKGKGLIERKIIKIRRGVTLFEFKGVSRSKLIWITNKINKKLKIKINFFFKKSDIFYKIWSKKNQYTYYYNKYLMF